MRRGSQRWARQSKHLMAPKDTWAVHLLSEAVGTYSFAPGRFSWQLLPGVAGEQKGMVGHQAPSAPRPPREDQPARPSPPPSPEDQRGHVVLPLHPMPPPFILVHSQSSSKAPPHSHP